MNILDAICTSEARPLIDELLLAQSTSIEISRAVAAKHDVVFTPESIDKYRDEVLKKGEAPIQQMVKMARDLSSAEPPPTDEFSKLSFNFSFKKTNEDLEIIYERIRDLRPLARANPDDPTFDRRIKEYLAQAESIRTRVFRQQYEQIRQAILLTVGKKLCAAAVSVLMPYIHKDYKAEAMRRFQAAVESLLDLKTVPDMPKDIADVAEEQA